MRRRSLLEAAYVIGANYLLSTEWLNQKINRRSDKLQIGKDASDLIEGELLP